MWSHAADTPGPREESHLSVQTEGGKDPSHSGFILAGSVFAFLFIHIF